MPDDPFFTGEPTGAFTDRQATCCAAASARTPSSATRATCTSFVEHGNQVVLTHDGAPFITEPSRVENSLARKVVLEGIARRRRRRDSSATIPSTGRATASSPPGSEPTTRIHGGAGDDIVHGGQGDDFLFGDDGRDAIWGGDHDDHAWGGYEGDSIDVLPRTTEETGIAVDDPITWFFFAPDDPDTVDNPATEAREGYDGYRGFDIIYGGWGQDAMQANEGDNGPVEGDRLVDWVGAYNAYYLCPATYGEFVSTRQMSPSLLDLPPAAGRGRRRHRRARWTAADRLRLRRAGAGLQDRHQAATPTRPIPTRPPTSPAADEARPRGRRAFRFRVRS